MQLDIGEKDLSTGVLALVVGLTEIIKEALQLQAIRRMEEGDLTEAEIERLGEALLNLDSTIKQLKADMGIGESVKAIRDSLDNLVDNAVTNLLQPACGRNLIGGTNHGSQ